MIIPAKRLIWAILWGFPLTFLPLLQQEIGLVIWLSYLVFLTVLTLFEYVAFLSLKLNCSLELSEVYCVGKQEEIILFIDLDYRYSIFSQVYIWIEGEVEVTPIEKNTYLDPGPNYISFRLLPLKRGNIEFLEIRLRILGYLQLEWCQRHYVLSKICRVVPNIQDVGRFGLHFPTLSKLCAGAKAEKYQSEGSEFDSLREYQPDFDPRTVDWKVSARKGKLYCREFRAERNHEIILALDCGRLMSYQSDNIAKLDYAINSLLLISYYIIKSGDKVGFMSFSNKVYNYFNPQSNIATVDKMSKLCENIDYSFAETNFAIAMEYLLKKRQKRTLVIIFTDFIDSISMEVFQNYLKLMTSSHLVLFVAVRDPLFEENNEPQNLIEFHQNLACHRLKQERAKLFAGLRHMGIYCLDLSPKAISLPVLEKYLQIRGREKI